MNHIFLNVALHTEFPTQLEEAFKRGDEDKMKLWALEQIRRLIDGEDVDFEFGAELLSISVRSDPNPNG